MRIFLFASGIAMLAANGACAQAKSVDAKATASTAAANRESFAAFGCKFKVAFGSSDNLIEARTGRFLRERECLGRWAVRGDERLWELQSADERLFAQAKEKATKEKARTFSAPAGAVSDLRLEGRGLFLVVSPELRSANVGHAQVDRRLGADFTPFNYGCMGANEEASPARLIQSSLEGRTQLRSLREEGERIRAEVVDGPSKYSMELDPRRGCLATSYLLDSGVNKTEAVLLNASESSDGRWFPTRIVGLVYSDPRFVQVYEIQVTSLQVDPPPRDEDLSAALPAGIRVAFAKDLRKNFVSDGSNVNAGQLQDVLDRCLAVASPSDGSGLRMAAAILGGSAILFLLARAFRRAQAKDGSAANAE